MSTKLHPTRATTSVPLGASPPARKLLVPGAMALLFLSALPDAMVVPVLRELVIERHDVGIGAAHAFMSINLVGALLVVGGINRLKRLGRPGPIIAGAAMLNAALLALMALPIGFFPTLLMRGLEGAADLTVYAMLFDIIADAGPADRRGRRMGAAATSLMLGISCGLGMGGVAGRTDATMVLWLGALACVMVAIAAGFLRRNRNRQFGTPMPSDQAPTRDGRGALRPALVMMFADRAVSGVLVSTIPLFLASVADYDSAMIGGLIGLSMLMTALGAWPCGRLADRFGPLRVRLVAGLIFALGFGSLIAVGATGPIVTSLSLLAFGLAGAALFASSLLIVCQSGRGATGMAAYHTAGNLGFLLGPVVSGAVLHLQGDNASSVMAFAAIILGFATLHATTTLVTCTGLVRMACPLRRSQPAGPVIAS